jgi:hypothetical protein
MLAGSCVVMAFVFSLPAAAATTSVPFVSA